MVNGVGEDFYYHSWDGLLDREGRELAGIDGKLDTRFTVLPFEIYKIAMIYKPCSRALHDKGARTKEFANEYMHIVLWGICHRCQ